METFSTLEVAKQVGVSPQTLERWIGSGKIQAPRTICIGCNVIRKWTAQDVGRVLTCKLQNYGVWRQPAVVAAIDGLDKDAERKRSHLLRLLMVDSCLRKGHRLGRAGI